MSTVRTNELKGPMRVNIGWVWQFGLYPIDEKRTRLVSRSRVRSRTLGVVAHICD